MRTVNTTKQEQTGAAGQISNITLTGSLGSGKSSVCKELRKKGYEIVSSGDIFRQIAEDRGLSVVELNAIAQTDKSIDKLIDDRTTEWGKQLTNTVFDSRVGWHFVKDSFKVFIYVGLEEASRRIYGDTTRKSESYDSMEECRQAIIKRQQLEQERYYDLYGVDYYNVDNYDLVIDSTNVTPKEAAEMIIRCFDEFREGKVWEKTMLMCPVSLYPSKNTRELSAERIEEYCSEYKEAGTAKDSPVTIAVENGFLIIVDGHHRFAAQSKCGMKFIRCRLVDGDNHKIAGLSDLNDMEDRCGIRYLVYPQENTTGGCILHK